MRKALLDARRGTVTHRATRPSKIEPWGTPDPQGELKPGFRSNAAMCSQTSPKVALIQ